MAITKGQTPAPVAATVLLQYISPLISLILNYVSTSPWLLIQLTSRLDRHLLSLQQKGTIASEM